LGCDRAAIDRVYYSRRFGQKAQFKETRPLATLENPLPQDLKKEAVPCKTCGLDN